MCIYICSSQPLFIAHLLETLQPCVENGCVSSFNQHFDVVFENHGVAPIEDLLILHQRRMLPNPEEFARMGACWPIPCEHITDNDPSLGDVPFRTRPKKKGGVLQIELRSAANQVLGSVINDPESQVLGISSIKSVHIDDMGLKPEQYFSIFADDSALPSVLRVHLKKPVLPFDHRVQDRHILRLRMPGVKTVPVAVEPLELLALPGNPGAMQRQLTFIKQTFETVGPEFLHQLAIARLAAIAESPSNLCDAAKHLIDKLVQGCLLKASATPHIHDHRIAVITSAECMLLDSHVRGGLTFWQRRAAVHTDGARSIPPEQWLNVWTWGAAWNPVLDPVEVAKRLHEVMRPEPDEDVAYRVHELVALVGPGVSRSSVVAILTALKSLGYVGEERNRDWFWIGSKQHLPEDDRLRVSIREKLAGAQSVKTGWLKTFDEQPFTLSFGLGTVAIIP